MWIGVISIFPDMFSAITEFGITRKAFENNLLELHTWNPRDFTRDRHRTVDDRPYGGGPGMLMMVEPLRLAIQAAKNAAGDETKVIYMSPQGKKLDQASVRSLATTSKLIIVSGRYEGIDERLIQSEVDEEWSIGDYVLSGGELPSMVLIDAVARLIPGVLGHSESAVQDSYTDDLLDSPHYTRPEEIDGMCVPEVLLSGNHEQIRRWRLKQSLMRTWSRRPDLLENRELTVEERTLLNEILDEIN